MSSLIIETMDGIEVAQVKRSLLGNALVTCSYWVDGVIIDTGPHRLEKEFAPFFQARKIEKVALTHSHEDHSGNAAYLAGKGIPVYLHQEAVAQVAQRESIPFYRWTFWRPRPPFKAKPVPPVLETAGGNTIQAIEAPGHTTDHMAYYYREAGVMFTGDLFVSTVTKVGLPWENYVAWMESLSKLLTYDFDLVCCGHSGFVTKGKQALGKKLENLQELQGEIMRLHEQGLPVEEINKRLFGSGWQARILLSGGEWDSVHIVRSFVKYSQKEA